MRSLRLFFKQIGFVEDRDDGLPGHLGELPIVRECRVIGGDGGQDLDAKSAREGLTAIFA